jgi:hypothetical protein
MSRNDGGGIYEHEDPPARFALDARCWLQNQVVDLPDGYRLCTSEDLYSQLATFSHTALIVQRACVRVCVRACVRACIRGRIGQCVHGIVGCIHAYISLCLSLSWVLLPGRAVSTQRRAVNARTHA